LQYAGAAEKVRRPGDQRLVPGDQQARAGSEKQKRTADSSSSRLKKPGLARNDNEKQSGVKPPLKSGQWFSGQ
jgi:hypothetical protein